MMLLPVNRTSAANHNQPL